MLKKDVFPWKVQEIKKDMGINFKEKTHIKLLLRKKEV